MLKISIKNRIFRLLNDVIYFLYAALKVAKEQVYGKSQKHRGSKPNYSDKVNHSISLNIR